MMQLGRHSGQPLQQRMTLTKKISSTRQLSTLQELRNNFALSREVCFRFFAFDSSILCFGFFDSLLWILPFFAFLCFNSLLYSDVLILCFAFDSFDSLLWGRFNPLLWFWCCSCLDLAPNLFVSICVSPAQQEQQQEQATAAGNSQQSRGETFGFELETKSTCLRMF